MTKELICICDCGLANRLRTLCGCYIISQELKRNLIICWIKRENCDADFSDLFNTNLKVISKFPDTTQLKLYKANKSSCDIYRSDLAGIKDNNDDVIVVRGCNAPFGLDKDKFDLVKEFYDKIIQPVNIINEKIINNTKLFTEKTIGIHVRIGDLYDIKQNYFFGKITAEGAPALRVSGLRHQHHCDCLD